LLAEHNVEVAEIHSSAELTTISLVNKTDQGVLQSLLTKSLGDDYVIASSTENDAPTWLKMFDGKPIKLGLDLSGGVLFVLDVDTERAFSERLKSIALEIKSIAIENRIRAVKVSQPNKQSITIDFSTANQESIPLLLAKISETYPGLTQKNHSDNQISFSYLPQQQVQFRQETMKHTLKTMRGRIEELGIPKR